MDHIERQKELLEAIGFVVPGNVYKIHYTVLQFGYAGSPTHFTTNVTEKLENIEALTVIPISTKRKKTKNIVSLNLSKDSNLEPLEEEILDLDSFALVGLPKQIKVEKLFEEPATHMRGVLREGKRNEILAARKKHIQSQFHRQGGLNE